jgi:hypothetical protein
MGCFSCASKPSPTESYSILELCREYARDENDDALLSRSETGRGKARSSAWDKAHNYFRERGADGRRRRA